MKKPQILLVHGFRGNHIGLKEIKSLLEKDGFEVFAPDIPPAIDESVSVEAGKAAARAHPLEKDLFRRDGYADWVAAYIKKHGLKKPILVGHSMGSIIVASVAEKYPDLIHEKIVFLAPISVTPPKFIKYLAPLTTVLPNKLIGYITTTYLIIDKSDKRQVLKTTYRCAKYVTRKRDVARAAKFSMSYSISDFQFEKTPCFIAGESDRLNNQSATSALAKRHGTRAVFLKNTGHLLNYECPEKVAKEIIKFIS